MELSEVTETIELHGSLHLNDFLKNNWIIVNTRNKDGQDWYIVGRNNEKDSPEPKDYVRDMELLTKALKR